MLHLRTVVLVSTTLLTAAASAFGAAVTYSATGADPASITGTINQFRADIGGANNGAGGSFTTGRREINWDGVGAAFRNPHPANFFNSNSPRGIEYSTPGTGFAVSGDAGSPQALFADLMFFDPTTEFQPFSGQRLFGILGSDTMDVRFFLPGTATVATTSAFGVVFVDADNVASSLTFYDQNDVSLGTFNIGPGANQSLSFLGVLFNAGERVGRVRIQAGSGAFTSSNCVDCVVMDDFIFAEPQAEIPEPATVLLSIAGLGLLAVGRRRR